MTDLDRAILDAWEKIRPHLQSKPDQLHRRLARRRQTMLRRPMRHCCLALRANDNRINPYHWIITPEHALDLDHPDHPYAPIEHEVLLQTPQLRKFYTPVRLDGWGEEVPHLAKMLGCSSSMLHRARICAFFRERRVPHLGGKRGKPVPILHYDRSLFPGGTWFFQAPHSILGGAWSWLPDLLPDDFEQSVLRKPVFYCRSAPSPGTPGEGWGEGYSHNIPLSDDDYRFAGWRWLCPACKKQVRKIYYPVSMRDLSGFLKPDPALEITPHLDEPEQLPDFPPTFACAKCHNIQHFTSLYQSGWNNLIAHMTAGLLFGHEVTPPPWFQLGGRKRARIRQLNRPSPRRDQVLRRLLNGWSNKRIQRDLQITKGALDSHLQNLFRQHDVPDRHALVAKIAGPALSERSESNGLAPSKRSASKGPISPPLNQHERAAQRRFQVQDLLLQSLPLKEMIQQLKTDYVTLMRDLHAIYRHHDIPPTQGRNNARRALAKKLGIELPPIGAQLMTIKVHSLHAAGLPIPQIAQQLHRCEAVIRRHLKHVAPDRSTAAANSELASIPSPPYSGERAG